MKFPLMISLLVLSGLLLAACGGLAGERQAEVKAPVVVAPQVEAPQVAVPEVEAPEVPAPQVEAPEVVAPQVDGPQAAAANETLVDEQGAVSVAVTPLNAGQDANTLDFEVAMNTHSVDLSMDLSQLAMLTVDTGRKVTAVAWSGEAGGHHVSGVLSFPAQGDGALLLEGAATMTLTVQNVDAPVRTFTWRLQ